MLPAEVVLAACLIGGVRIPGAVLLGVELLMLMLLGAEVFVWLRLRRRGLSRRETLAELVPEPVLRVADLRHPRTGGARRCAAAVRRAPPRTADQAARG
ncbi:integral membrane protein [Streptomyces sp. 769]|nr:integral membrane protein [Streptomyces sp. 769]